VVDIQRGQSDELTRAAGTVFSGSQEAKNTSFIYLTVLIGEYNQVL
jgi:hypothetical protein